MFEAAIVLARRVRRENLRSYIDRLVACRCRKENV